ncbi:MAG: dihydropteroate synthase [Actinobacteria bacterium]|nr:dihydropteroate synthase [Actinomycetota bacterium]
MMVALGSRRYDVAFRALVMGILDRTPGSFPDRYDLDASCRRAEQLVHDGADLLDVGGVTAGRGAEASEAEELDQLVPVIEALHVRFDVPLSCDTSRAAVARAAFAAGAAVANDVSGFTDPGYLPAAAAAGASVVATHVRMAPRVRDPRSGDDEVLGEVAAALRTQAERAEATGIARERILLDAGLDLGKTAEQSLALLRGSPVLAALGYPVLLSASHKPFLGALLALEVSELADATVAAHSLGIIGGCRVLRAHDARAARRVADVLAAVLPAGRLSAVHSSRAAASGSAHPQGGR